MTSEFAKTLVPAAIAALVILAALKDIASFTIPNWISIALVAAFVPAALLTGASLATIGMAFAIAVGMLVVAIGMFAMGWMGGGDAKLMTAVSLWVGLKGLAAFALCTGLAGGALALGLLALRSTWLRPIADMGPAWARRLATPDEAAPYGVAIALGALAAFSLAHPLA